MVTDSLVKKKFVHETLQEGILKIFHTGERGAQQLPAPYRKTSHHAFRTLVRQPDFGREPHHLRAHPSLSPFPRYAIPPAQRPHQQVQAQEPCTLQPCGMGRALSRDVP